MNRRNSRLDKIRRICFRTIPNLLTDKVYEKTEFMNKGNSLTDRSFEVTKYMNRLEL